MTSPPDSAAGSSGPRRGMHHRSAAGTRPRRSKRFFDPRVAELSGGPRNLAGAVEAILLCAEKASVHAPGVERAFGPR